MVISKRYEFIDNVNGLLIIHMIAFHIFQAGKTGTAEIIMRPLSFFMFWFFYKSGCFYKPQTFYKLLHNGLLKLFVPYVVFSIVGYIVWIIRQLVVLDYNRQTFIIDPINELLYTGTLPGNVALWFLPSLLATQLIFHILITGGAKPLFVLFVCISITTILYYTKSEFPYYCANIPLGLAAYSFGYMIREYQYNVTLFCVASICYMGILIFIPSVINFRENDMIGNGNYFLAIFFLSLGV